MPDSWATQWGRKAAQLLVPHRLADPADLTAFGRNIIAWLIRRGKLPAVALAGISQTKAPCGGMPLWL